MHCMTLGVFLSALLHPILVASGIWCLLPAQMGRVAASPLLTALSGLNLFLLIAGYSATALSMQIAMKRIRLPGWPKLVATLPAYWLLLSLAAWQSVFDFMFAPFHWHKTEHGLTRLTQPRDKRRKDRPVRTIYNREP